MTIEARLRKALVDILDADASGTEDDLYDAIQRASLVVLDTGKPQCEICQWAQVMDEIYEMADIPDTGIDLFDDAFTQVYEAADNALSMLGHYRGDGCLDKYTPV